MRFILAAFIAAVPLCVLCGTADAGPLKRLAARRHGVTAPVRTRPLVRPVQFATRRDDDVPAMLRLRLAIPTCANGTCPTK